MDCKVQLCQRAKQRGHARATQWVSLTWQGYKGHEMSATKAYCDKCVGETGVRVLEAVVVTKRSSDGSLPV